MTLLALFVHYGFSRRGPIFRIYHGEKTFSDPDRRRAPCNGGALVPRAIDR